MAYPPDPYWKIEVIHDDVKRGKFKSAIFDFDGTLSLIREGWQGVMIPYFVEVLKETPLAEDEESIEKCVTDFVDLLTGKQTIYQAIQLAEEVKKRGGVPLDPLEYKREYNRRLMERIRHRIEGLKSGKIAPEDMVVPGTFELLTALKERGLVLYLASGTDEPYVLDEARSLGIDVFFDGIYGAQDQYKLFSKAKVIQHMIEKHHLSGDELLGFGDGFVEIENVKSAGGLAVGVASDEVRRAGINQWKRNRLINAGADIIIPDYRKTQDIIDYLFPT
ncbi:Phosphoglycolate phosphatase, HAD superfamily [Caldanaerobius fijiensis DSM 17918]|uniref:Phosphoglycolate phosphatase, HAD superfamily n=1 Tax=Caldanaerobius fijiensis DSM 17918 TaxID=1121256 RepID=A0A1M4ZGD9_9THEO|nr:HAD family hydrolase [Caldanaerobius fijiensis]SHF17035.1 Phosphoglycolate phosphatase, HAD superfamily [Caldanaerobius fijiensis DSM 17918]